MATRKISRKIEREIRAYVAELKKENLPIASVYLFGSYAKGTPRDTSDVDVCIVSPQFTDFFDTLQYLWRRRPRHSLIEPIGFAPRDLMDENDTALTREIKRTGIKVSV